MTPRIRAAFLALVTLAAVAACRPTGLAKPVPLRPAADPPPIVTPAGAPHYVYGDSLAVQILEATVDDGRVWRTQVGATLATWQAEVDAAIANPATVSITLALGGNDISPGTGGWTADDEARWRDTIARAHAAGVCVAGVQSWFLPAADTVAPGWIANMEASRILWPTLGFDSLTDWRPVVEAQPSIISADGIHINWGGPDSPSVQARYGVVSAAAAGCGA